MQIIFTEHDHAYKSLDEDIDWISVTSLISYLKKPFDPIEVSQKCSRNRKSKWYGLTPEEIRQHWENESKRSTDLGNWYHSERESDLTATRTYQKDGVNLSIVPPTYNEYGKLAPEQKLQDNTIYPEHMAYLKSAGLIGQSDIVEVMNGVLSIYDHKTNKEIKQQAYTSWEGITDKLATPLSHLDDCNYVHYNLQLSLYMFVILKHNPRLKPGKIVVNHVIFKEQEKDKWGNPVYVKNAQGDFEIDRIDPYEMPYLKAECITLINYLKDNRYKFSKKKLAA